MQAKYDWQQKVISLIWLSYCISIPKTYFGSQEYLQKLATQSIKAVLADSKIRGLIGKWEMVWGCGVSQLGKKSVSSDVNDHTIFIVKDLDSTEIDRYVISLAGTNPFSVQDMLLEDVNIAISKPWNNGEPWKTTEKLFKTNDKPAVTKGISKSLRVLMTQIKSDGKLLLDYLLELTSNAKKPIEITVAGHSLAGAISPSLALSLVEQQKEWDKAKIATTVKVVSVAGFSPGNGAFADYYDQTLGPNTVRIWNRADIVPNVWEAEALKKVPGMYDPYIPTNLIFQLVFNQIAEGTCEAQDYQFILKSVPGFANEYKPNLLLDDPSIRDVVLDVCSETISYACMIELQTVDILDIFDDQIEDFTQDLTDFIKNSLKLMVEFGEDCAETLKEGLEELLDQYGGFGGFLLRGFSIPANIYGKIFSQSTIVELFNYILQVLYQHVWAYVHYYKIDEFDQRRQEITTQTVALIEEAEKSIQPTNTVIVKYGAAKSDDIKDLYNGEGKLFIGIADKVEQLKKSEEVSKNAQPIIFVVEKKKEEKGIFDWF
ncbi:MAG: hypothetical protein AAGJ08_20575 [Cyanobacteria bacterium P01_H01_bin.35]